MNSVAVGAESLRGRSIQHLNPSQNPTSHSRQLSRIDLKSETMPISHPETIQLDTENVDCLCCGSSSSQRLFTEDYTLQDTTAKLGVNRCENCGLVFVSPRLTPAATQLVYELDAENTISSNYCWDGSVSEKRFEPLLGRLATRAPSGRLLDVGCGGGHFLRAAKRFKLWQVTGLEPVGTAAEQASMYANCEVLTTTLEDANLPPKSFEVITMLGVLEHLHDPLETLRQTRRLLTDNGLIGIYVPNFNYLRWKDTGPLSYLRNRRWSTLHPQEHLLQYQPATLRRLLTTAGFRTMRVDVGRPFMHGRLINRLAKQVAYGAIRSLHSLTGLHFGGLEVIAQVDPTLGSMQQADLSPRRKAG